jgi:hypothetical protein
LLLLYVVFYVLFAARLIASPYGLDQGEGYDVWSAWLIGQGQWPYTDNAAPPYYSSNYPPLWSAIVAIPMTFTGPALAPGRTVATAATLATALLLGAAAYRRTHARTERPAALLAAALAAGLFLASPYVFHTTPLARVNSLALLFAVLALGIFEIPTRGRILAGALVLVVALFSKPTTLDAVLAATAFAMLIHPRAGALAGGIVGLVGLTSFLGIEAATGGAFWLNVIAANNNPFEFEQLVKYVANFTALHLLLLVLAAREWWEAIQRRAISPWIFYWPIALVGALTVGKWGAGESYFLSALAVTSLLAACRIARLVTRGDQESPSAPLSAAITRESRRRPRPVPRNQAVRRPQPRGRARAEPWQGRIRAFALLELLVSSGEGALAGLAVCGGWLGASITRVVHTLESRPMWLAAALLLQALVLAHGPLSSRVSLLADHGPQAMFLSRPYLQPEADALSALTDRIRAAPGPVLSEEPSLVIAASKPVFGNPTQLRHLYDAGQWDASRLVVDLEARRFSLVILNAQLFPAPVLSAIGQRYVLDDTIRIGESTYRVFIPGP